MDKNNLITINELCKQLSIPRGTFDSWLQRGKLDEAKLQGNKTKTIFFYKDKIYNLIEDLRKTNTPKNNNLNENQNENKGPSLSQSRAIREAYVAQLAKLEYEEKINSLIPMKKVKKTFYNAGRIIRNNLLTIPGRLSAELATINDPVEIDKKLTEEIIEILSEIQKHEYHEQ